MTDQPFPDRVTQLRRRWDADRTSRLFLQLAEEYRQLGRLRESVEVLDAGLVEHPGYLSALVAKGRCHLELGEPQAAREALERVVRQDATQAVASKLLVRSYLDLGELVRARERLSLYALLHETDPDIAELRRRLEAPEPVPSPLATVGTSGTDHPPVAAAVGEEPLTPARSDAMNEDIFDLGIPSGRPVEGPPSDDMFGLYRETQPRPAALLHDLEAETARENDDGEIFPGLGGAESRRRWAEGISFGGLFDLASLNVHPLVTEAPLFAADFSPSRFEAQQPTPIFVPESSRLSLGFEPPFVIPQPPEPIAIPAVAAFEAFPEISEVQEAPEIQPIRESPASRSSDSETVTLAELYLGQGHRAEALRILDQVLLREPTNQAARALFSRIRGDVPASPEPELAPDEETFTTRLAPLPFLDSAARTSEPSPAPPTAVATKPQRKIQLLTAYLERLRRGSAPGVS